MISNKKTDTTACDKVRNKYKLDAKPPIRFIDVCKLSLSYLWNISNQMTR